MRVTGMITDLKKERYHNRQGRLFYMIKFVVNEKEYQKIHFQPKLNFGVGSSVEFETKEEFQDSVALKTFKVISRGKSTKLTTDDFHNMSEKELKEERLLASLETQHKQEIFNKLANILNL